MQIVNTTHTKLMSSLWSFSTQVINTFDVESINECSISFNNEKDRAILDFIGILIAIAQTENHWISMNLYQDVETMRKWMNIYFNVYYDGAIATAGRVHSHLVWVPRLSRYI